jgi:hypothetical protein
MQEFVHKPLFDFTQIESYYNERGHRVYVTPEGKKFPSITTVLSITKENIINDWIGRVGEEEAEKIKHSAGVRGTIIHEQVEDYLNGVYDPKKYPAIHRMTFNTLKPLINEVTEVNHLEVPLYSNYLKVAGRCDLIGRFRGKRSVIDFKTSKRKKAKEDITNYFMQASGYCVMFEEMTGIPIKQIVIMIAVDNEDSQIYIEDRDNWVRSLIHYRQIYGDRYGEPN